MPNKYPLFGLTPNFGTAHATTGNTNRDGTGTIYLLLTAGAGGSRVERISIKSQVTTTAGMARLFSYDGTNYRLLDEQLMTAITASGTVASFSGFFNPALFPMILKNGLFLYVSINNAEATDFVAHGEDY